MILNIQFNLDDVSRLSKFSIAWPSVDNYQDYKYVENFTNTLF